MDKLQVAIVGVEPCEYSSLRNIIVRAGHDIALYADTDSELIAASGDSLFDLLAVGVETEKSDSLSRVKLLVEAVQLPVIVICSSCDPDFFEPVTACGPVAVVVSPLREPELLAAIFVAQRRHLELVEMRKQLAAAALALEERKQVERAKGIVSRKLALDEANALKHLQKLARSRRQKLSEIAAAVILGVEALG